MADNPTILIVDDSEDDRYLCRRALKASSYGLVMAATAGDGLAEAVASAPALILLDYNLPDFNGIEFMERLSGLSAAPPPIVMMTGEGNEAVAVEAMKAGASDYVVKDTKGGYLRLLPSIISRVRSSFEEHNRSLRLSAIHDAILGTVADGIIGLDQAGAILFANPAAQRMLLCPDQQLIGRHITDFLRQADPQAGWSEHPLAQIHDGSVAFHREIDWLERVGGGSFPSSYTASPLDFEGKGHFGWVLVFRDITERKKTEEELILTARYDTLTGLPNRLMFQDYLAKALSRAERGGRHLALLFLDLDGFKAVNDTLGHFCGDLLLQQVAQRLTQCLRTGDFVSRLGGDEFTIILEDCQPEHIVHLAEKIVRVLEAPYDVNGNAANVSASIGISLYPQCGKDSHTLLQKADSAMYEVKRSGKKGHRFSCQSGCTSKGCSLLPASQACPVPDCG